MTRTWLTKLVGIAGLSLVSAVALPLAAQTAQAGTPPAVAAPVVVTPAEASDALHMYETFENIAYNSYDAELQDAIEAGSIRTIDDANFRIEGILGYSGTSGVGYSGAHVYLPRQTHYPAVFLALARTRFVGQSGTTPAGLLFQKTSASSTWRLTGYMVFTPAETPVFTVDADGYIPTLDPSTLSTSPAALYPALLKAENVAATGQTPSAAWAFDSVWKQDLSVTAAEAVDVHTTDGSTHLAPVCLASKAGALCLLSNTSVSVETLTPAELAAGTRWPVDNPDDQFNSGGVAQGQYTSLTIDAEINVAVVVPVKHTAAKLVLTSVLWGPISGTGTLG